MAICSKPDTFEKLQLLSRDSQYDLACACGSDKSEHRTRGRKGKWIYPVTLPNGGTALLFKTLISNVCSSDCKYCPLRQDADAPRCTLNCDEIVKTFLDYYNNGEVFGLFLSSGIIGSADATMEKLIAPAETLRKKHGFKGYIHLKILPGSSPAAIKKAISVSNAVSLNIETPGKEFLDKLTSKKDFVRDIVEPMKLISRLISQSRRKVNPVRERGSLTNEDGLFIPPSSTTDLYPGLKPGAFSNGVKQTTQFIVGAAEESDRHIVNYTAALYERIGLNRVYFSAYQRNQSDNLKAQNINPEQSFMREHRLYQVDFLLRKYGFNKSDIIYDSSGLLSFKTDPKEVWAKNHPQFFPVNVNTATRYKLLRVPGFGLKTVETILNKRKLAKIHTIDDIDRAGSRLLRAAKYLDFGDSQKNKAFLFNF